MDMFGSYFVRCSSYFPIQPWESVLPVQEMTDLQVPSSWYRYQAWLLPEQGPAYLEEYV